MGTVQALGGRLARLFQKLLTWWRAYLNLHPRWVRHSTFLICFSLFLVAYIGLGLSKFGDTNVLAIASCLFIAQVVLLFVTGIEASYRVGWYRVLAYFFAFIGGWFVPTNLLLYHFGIHPLEEVSGALWMVLSAAVTVLAGIYMLLGTRITLWDGWLYPVLYGALILGGTAEYVVWISGA